MEKKDRKKVLIVIPSFKHGGTNKSLENLLTTLKGSDDEYYVFSLNQYGPYSSLKEVTNILPSNPLLDLLTTPLESKRGLKVLFALVIKVIFKFCKIFGIDLYRTFFKKAARKIMNRDFEVVISFQEGFTTDFVSHFNSKIKIAWIRSDYSEYCKLNNNKCELRIYEKFSKIICVSDYTKEVFLKIYPSLLSKTIAVHNIINSDKILERSRSDEKLDTRFNSTKFTLISVGRIDPVKRFSHIPKIIHELKLKNVDILWYIIGGEGRKEERDKLNENIEKYKVADNLILLGIKNNPYPYIAAADLLVCLSSSEACPNVINEAKILKTPVISADFGSVEEFIENNKTGFIRNLNLIGDQIEEIYHNRDIYNEIKNNLLDFEYENEPLILKIKSTINGNNNLYRTIQIS